MEQRRITPPLDTQNTACLKFQIEKKKVWEVENWSKSLSKIKTIQARAPLLRVTMRVGAS